VLRGPDRDAVEFAPNRQVKATFSRDLPAGRLRQRGTLKCTRFNLQAGTRRRHAPVYSQPLLVMGTYSLTDLTVARVMLMDQRRGQAVETRLGDRRLEQEGCHGHSEHVRTPLENGADVRDAQVLRRNTLRVCLPST